MGIRSSIRSAAALIRESAAQDYFTPWAREADRARALQDNPPEQFYREQTDPDLQVSDDGREWYEPGDAPGEWWAGPTDEYPTVQAWADAHPDIVRVPVADAGGGFLGAPVAGPEDADPLHAISHPEASPQGPHVTVYRRKLAAEINDGERQELGVSSVDYEPEPDEIDLADFAERVIRENNCDIEPSCSPRWGGPGTWYADESYPDPYTGEVTEVSAHLHGIPDDAARTVYDRLFPQRQVDVEAGS